MSTPPEEDRRVGLAKREPIFVVPQSFEFDSFVGREMPVGVYCEQLITPVEVHVHAALRDVPQRRVVQLFKGSEIELEFGRYVVPRWWAAKTEGVQRDVLERLFRRRRGLFEALVEHFGEGQSQGCCRHLRAEPPVSGRRIAPHEVVGEHSGSFDTPCTPVPEHW